MLNECEPANLIIKQKSKSELREEIDADIRRFLDQGKNVTSIPRGISSRDEATSPLRPEKWHMEKSSGERTYLPEVIDALEQRKKAISAKPNTTSQRKKTPRKKLIYDDFGEPLRWVWVDE